MDVLIRTHRYRWHCPDCGAVEDRSVEVMAGLQALGRWFEDGHQGLVRIDENVVEHRVFEHLRMPFLVLEKVRSARGRRRLEGRGQGVELDDQDRALFDAELAQQGHRVSRQEHVFLAVPGTPENAKLPAGI